MSEHVWSTPPVAWRKVIPMVSFLSQNFSPFQCPPQFFCAHHKEIQSNSSPLLLPLASGRWSLHFADIVLLACLCKWWLGVGVGKLLRWLVGTYPKQTEGQDLKGIPPAAVAPTSCLDAFRVQELILSPDLSNSFGRLSLLEGSVLLWLTSVFLEPSPTCSFQPSQSSWRALPFSHDDSWSIRKLLFMCSQGLHSSRL